MISSNKLVEYGIFVSHGAGERLALNILQRMSGIATATRRLVALIPAASKTKYADGIK